MVRGQNITIQSRGVASLELQSTGSATTDIIKTGDDFMLFLVVSKNPRVPWNPWNPGLLLGPPSMVGNFNFETALENSTSIYTSRRGNEVDTRTWEATLSSCSMQ